MPMSPVPLVFPLPDGREIPCVEITTLRRIDFDGDPGVVVRYDLLLPDPRHLDLMDFAREIERGEIMQAIGVPVTYAFALGRGVCCSPQPS